MFFEYCPADVSYTFCTVCLLCARSMVILGTFFYRPIQALYCMLHGLIQCLDTFWPHALSTTLRLCGKVS